jgi:subtilisin family serine protease
MYLKNRLFTKEKVNLEGSKEEDYKYNSQYREVTPEPTGPPTETIENQSEVAPQTIIEQSTEPMMEQLTEQIGEQLPGQMAENIVPTPQSNIMNQESPSIIVPPQQVGINIDITKCAEFYLSEDYDTFVFEIEGDFYEDIGKLSYACAIPISPYLALVSVEKGKLAQLRTQVRGIIIIERSQFYTLSQIQPSEAANINIFHSDFLLNLTGKGTIIGFIDTGIDYQNEEFMSLDKKTRILEIWDQSQNTGKPPQNFSFGSVYTREDINRALEAKINGGDPFSIVPEVDNIGHGTANAGIAAATGVKIPKGAAPDCDIVMVKLKEVKRNSLEYAGIIDPMVPVYRSADIIFALQYLYELEVKYNKPMVIVIPLNSNYGGASGNSYLERFIDSFVAKRGVAIVAGSGNQGDSDTHTSGVIDRTGGFSNIEIVISEEERIVNVSIYGKSPDKFSIAIISPSGEIIDKAPTKIFGEDEFELTLEGSSVKIFYNITEERTGDQVVFVTIINARPGVWTIRIAGEYIVNGRYDAWLPQKELLKGDTRFLKSDPYTTVQSPGTAFNVITTAFYNQETNAIEPASGRGFTRDLRVRPIIATGGINVLTTFINDEIIVTSGSSAATSVLAGASALILEWGIVKGNDTSMYGPTVGSYIIRGARQRVGDVYPNREWGYGTLDLLKVFQNLRRLENNKTRKVVKDNGLERINENIFINLPQEIYYRLNFTFSNSPFFKEVDMYE